MKTIRFADIPPHAKFIGAGYPDGFIDESIADALDMAIATMACHGAIRAGDALAPEEGQALLRALDEIDDFSGHCPHGRPIVFSVPFGDLERRLGR